MVLCSRCGAENDEKAVFCQECGNGLRASAIWRPPGNMAAGRPLADVGYSSGSQEKGYRIIGIVLAVLGVFVGIVMVVIGSMETGGEFFIAETTPAQYHEIGTFIALVGTIIAVLSANALVMMRLLRRG